VLHFHCAGNAAWRHGPDNHDLLTHPKPRQFAMLKPVTQKFSQPELAESLSVLNATLSSTADGILVVNGQGKKIFQNQRVVELWKIPPAIAESDDDDAQVRHVMQAVAEPGRFKEKIMYYYSHPDEGGHDEIELKDGTIMERITGPVLGRDGTNYGRIWTFRDVTQSRRDQAALRESEANYYSLVDQMPAGIFRKDMEGRYVFVNSWFCRFKGAKPEDYLGKLPQELAAEVVSGPGGQSADAASQKAAGEQDHAFILRTGQQIEFDEKFTGADGKVAHFHTVKSPVFGPDGIVVGTQAFLTDITRRKEAEAALRDNEAFLNTVIENIPHMIFVKDAKELRFVKFNKGGQELLGYSLAELIGKNDYDFFPKGLADHYTENDRAVLCGRAVVDIPEESVKTRHQGERILHTKKIPIFDSAGRLLYLLGISEDITERKQAETELAYERDLLRTLMENSPDHIYFKDAQSRFIKSSDAQARQFGVGSAEGLVGKTDFDFFSEERARCAFEDEQEIIRTGQPIIGKMERETWKHGRGESWVLTTKMPLRNKAREIIGTFGISKDITALKQTEAELSYERDLLRTLLDSSPDTIFFKDLQSRLVRASQSELKNLLRVALSRHRDSHPHDGADKLPPHLVSLESFRDYVIGKTDADIYGQERAGSFRQDEPEIISSGQTMIGKIERTICVDGNSIWYMTTKVPWRNQLGEIIGTFGTSSDISDLKNAEAKVEEAHKRLLELSRQAGMAEVATNVLHNVGNVLNSVNVSAALVVDNTKKSKVPYLGKVVALLNEHAGDLGDFMSHDPKGRQLPGYLSQLAGQLAREQQHAVTELELLRQNIEHIKDIVAMQQNYAKISGVTETVNVTHLVEDALRMNAGALARHEVELVRVYADVPPVTVDKHRVLQILVNLIRNAKYACDDTGRKDKQLKLQVARTETGVRIAVIDNGIGIPPENLSRIFNHGFTTRKKGHGFGLHSGALAARELGGALTVESQGVGHGATFILELPTLPKSQPV
jgi:PAS domain S-box-containing protein